MNENPLLRGRPGGMAFAILFVLFALFLLSRITAETKISASGQLFAQPRFWPGVGVFGMVAFGVAHLVATWRIGGYGRAHEFLAWVRALEYFAWFMAYVTVVPELGYLAATLIFTVALALRQGYRGARALGIAALLGLAIVLVFKTGLSVRIPGGAVYEYLPAGWRNFMIVNF